LASLCCATPRGVEIVAERGADADHLVGGDLLALTGAAEHDAPVGGAGRHRAPDRRADRRIVDRGVAVRAVIVDRMSEPCERRLEVLFQREPRVVGTDRNPHIADCTVRFPAISCQLSAFSEDTNRAESR
jgi:hypothetical protein